MEEHEHMTHEHRKFQVEINLYSSGKAQIPLEANDRRIADLKAEQEAIAQRLSQADAISSSQRGEPKVWVRACELAMIEISIFTAFFQTLVRCGKEHISQQIGI